MITKELRSKGIYKVFYQHSTNASKVEVGEFVCLEDGYFVYWPVLNRKGYWDAQFLKEIIVALDNLNEKWDKQVKDYFSGQRRSNMVNKKSK